MIRSITFFSFILLSGLLCAMPASAQQQRSPWSFNIDAGAVHQSDADLKDGDGSFAVDRWFVGAGVNFSWDRRTSLGVSIGGGKSIYDFDDLTTIGDGGPWDSIDDSRISLTGRFGFGDNGAVFIIPTMRMNGEKGASNSDSRTWGIFGAVTWQLNEDLTIGPGIGVFSRLEDGTKVFPVLAIDWNISDRWNLSTGRGLASSQGPGLTLSYKLTEDWSLGVAGRYENTEFRLDDKGVVPGGVGRDQSIPLVFRAELRPSKKFGLAAFVGIEMSGKLKLKDSMGDLVEESKYDPAMLFGATFEYRF